MKKARTLIIAACAALAMSAISCSQKETVVAIPGKNAAPADTIVTLTNDSAFRMGDAVEYLTVLDFNASWCVPCKKLTPAYEKAADEFKGKVAFYSVDFTEMVETAKSFNVTSVPTVVVLRPNGAIQKHVGLDYYITSEQLNDSTITPTEQTEIIYSNLSKEIEAAMK